MLTEEETEAYQDRGYQPVVIGSVKTESGWRDIVRETPLTGAARVQLAIRELQRHLQEGKNFRVG